MKEILIAFALKYGLLFAAALVMGLFLIAAVLMPSIITLLKKWAEQIGSEKVSKRIKDALDKVGVVVGHLIVAEGDLYKQEIINAVKDGDLTKAEVVAIAEKLAKKAIEILAPEADTLKQYLCGDMVFDFMVSVVKSYMVDFITAKIQGKTAPFVTPASLNGNQPINK